MQAKDIASREELEGMLAGIGRIDGDDIVTEVAFTYETKTGTKRIAAGTTIDRGLTIKDGAFAGVKGQSTLARFLRSQDKLDPIPTRKPAARPAGQSVAASGGLPSLAQLSDPGWLAAHYGRELNESAFEDLQAGVRSLGEKLQRKWAADTVRARLRQLGGLTDDDLLRYRREIEALG